MGVVGDAASAARLVDYTVRGFQIVEQIRQGKSRSNDGIRMRGFRRGMGLVDLLVSIGIITLLGSFALVVISQTRSTARSSECLSNLNHISVAFTGFAADHGGHYPDPQAQGRSWESLLSTYIAQPMAFACPADNEIFLSVGSSYDWRDTTDPLTTLAGKRLIDGPPTAVLAFDTLPGWHTKHYMNVLLCSGSASAMSEDACLNDLLVPLTKTRNTISY